MKQTMHLGLVTSLLLTAISSFTDGYNHIETPYYKVILSSSYEDNLEGVHLRNKQEQDAAMQEFVAGRLAPGEMGNGIELEGVVTKEAARKEAMYQAHGFDEYISEYLARSAAELADVADTERDELYTNACQAQRIEQLEVLRTGIVTHNLPPVAIALQGGDLPHKLRAFAHQSFLETGNSQSLGCFQNSMRAATTDWGVESGVADSPNIPSVVMLPWVTEIYPEDAEVDPAGSFS